jgi:hypothetical protein
VNKRLCVGKWSSCNNHKGGVFCSAQGRGTEGRHIEEGGYY